MAGGSQFDYAVGIYSRHYLPLYHYIILFNFSVMWKCSVNWVLHPFFSEYFSDNHLDCGVADGYFPSTTLQRPYRKQGKPRVTLLDANPDALDVAKTRILSESPAAIVKTVKTDITAPLPEELQGAKFDSISMFNLFHCVPGGTTKWRAFSIFKDVLSDDGVLTGCTVLGEKYAPTRLSWLYSAFYNWRGIFSNWDDTKSDIESGLKKAFKEVDTWQIGQVLLFRARKPRKA